MQGDSLMTDIISSLDSRGCRHLLLLILSHLSSWDLAAFSSVCQTWADVLHWDFWPHRVVRHQLLENKLRGKYTAQSVTLDKYKHPGNV